MAKSVFLPAAIAAAALLLVSCGEEKPDPAKPAVVEPSATPTGGGAAAALPATLSIAEGYRVVEYRTVNCPWCNKLKDSLEALGAEVKGGLNVEYVYLDKTSERVEEAEKAGFKGFVPFLAVFDGDGKVVTTVGGYAPAKALKEKFVEAGVLK
jgi:glutaredoxin